MSAHAIMLVAAALAFGLGAANVPGINWLCAGACFVTLSWLV